MASASSARSRSRRRWRTRARWWRPAERAGVPLMVHENFRWQSAIQAVRAASIDAARSARRSGAASRFAPPIDVFSGQPYLAEGERFIIEDLGIHILDIARFLFGDVARLTARTRRVNPAIAARTSRRCCSITKAASPRSSIAATRRGWRSSRFPRRSSRSTARRAACASIRATQLVVVDKQRRRSRGRLAAAAALGVAALAQHPGERAGDPATLGRLPASGRGAGDFGPRQCEDARAGRGRL